MIFMTLGFISASAFAGAKVDLQTAIALAKNGHAIVRDKKEADENSGLLKQVNALISPALDNYKSLTIDERDLLAEAIVRAAQSDSSYFLPSEHQQALRLNENAISKSIEKLIANGVLTRVKADLFSVGLELGAEDL